MATRVRVDAAIAPADVIQAVITIRPPRHVRIVAVVAGQLAATTLHLPHAQVVAAVAAQHAATTRLILVPDALHSVAMIAIMIVIAAVMMTANQGVEAVVITHVTVVIQCVVQARKAAVLDVVQPVEQTALHPVPGVAIVNQKIIEIWTI